MKKKILIVEDEPSLLNILNDKFSSEGFEVAMAKNGKEGLDLALSGKPDLILLDILMPVMDGLTMAKKLRADEKGKTVPIIILTNLSDYKNAAEAMESGIYDFLIKADWKMDDLVKKVREKLAKV